MTDSPDDHRQSVAPFRYGVISELVRLPQGTAAWRAHLKLLSQRSWTIPGSLRTRVAPQTIRDWVRTYQSHGFEGLMPKPAARQSR